MDHAISQDDLFGAVIDALDIEPASLGIDSTRETIEGWDSLGHLNVLIALDKLTKGRAGEVGELADAQSMREIVDLLRSRGLIAAA